MQESKNIIGSNLKQIDSHVIKPHEYDEIPELSEDWFKSADLYEGTKLVRRGRPKVAKPKKLKSFKLAQEVIEAILASGKGYNARVEAVLRQAFVKGTPL